MEELEKLFREKSDCASMANIDGGFELEPAISLSRFKDVFVKLILNSSSLPLKEKYAELSELAKAFINEVDKQHPFVNLPEEEDFYMARHKLANSLKSDL